MVWRPFACLLAVGACACGAPSPAPSAAQDGGTVDAARPAPEAGDVWAFDGGGAFPTDASPPFDGNGGICIGPGEPCGDPNDAPAACCDPSSYRCIGGRCALGLCCGSTFVGDAGSCPSGEMSAPCW